VCHLGNIGFLLRRKIMLSNRKSLNPLAVTLGLFCLISLLLPLSVWALNDTPNQTTCVTNGAVYTMVRDGTTTYLGGSFTYVGPNTGHGVPLDTTTGSPVIPYPKVNGTVYAVAPDGSGGWYTRITHLIPSQGTPTQGAKYSHLDTAIEPGKTYFYKLEDISYSGDSTFHGPVASNF
jgi:hypothetical protein